MVFIISYFPVCVIVTFILITIFGFNANIIVDIFIPLVIVLSIIINSGNNSILFIIIIIFIRGRCLRLATRLRSWTCWIHVLVSWRAIWRQARMKAKTKTNIKEM